MELDELTDQLTNICTVLAQMETGETQAEPGEIDMAKAWPLLLRLGEEGNLKAVGTLNPLLVLYLLHKPGARNVTQKCCEDKVAVLADESKSFDERFAAAKALVSFLAVLSDELVVKVIEHVVHLAASFMKAKPAVVIPMSVLELLDLVTVDDFDPPTVELFGAKLKEMIGGPEKAAAIFVFAVFAHELMEMNEDEYPGFVVEVITEGMKAPERDVEVASCNLLSAVGGHWAHCDSQGAPSVEALFEMLVPLMLSEDVLVSKHGHKAFKALVSCGLFNTPDMAKKLLEDLYPRYRKEQLRFFFRAVLSFVFPSHDDCDSCCCEEDHEEVNLDIVQLIVDMLKVRIRDSDDIVAGLSLSALGEMTYKDKMFVEDLIGDALEVAKALVEKKNVKVYEFVARLCVAMFENFKEETQETVLPLIPQIASELANPEVGDMKHRIYTAAAVAVVVSGASITDQYATVVKFVLDNIDEDSEQTILLLCTVMIPLSTCLNDESANAIFRKLVTKVREGQSDDVVGNCCKVLQKLIKRYTIDKDVVASLVSAILSGDLKILHGQEPHKAMPPNQALFDFVGAYLKKLPTNGKAICEQMVDWLTATLVQSVPAILTPFKSGVIAGVVDEELAHKIAPILKELLKKFKKDDFAELGAVVRVLAELFTRHPKSIEPVSEVITLLEPFVTAADPDAIEEEEDIDEIANLVEIMPDVALFVFTVYGSNEAPPEVNEDVVLSLVNMLPFPSDMAPLSGILEQLCAMLNDPEKYGFAILPILKVFTEILLMTKKDAEEYAVSDEVTKEMKLSLKRLVQSDHKLELALTKPFKNKKATLNRFKALLR